ncbi:DUF3027 domain-containing protein [Nocardia sp. NPDC048505]|uniref:DUF3027 domain-containing protein n=1 Tax=unclassified Nocardia TaxID=2637762 RepID=UPI0033D22A8A
MRPLLADAVDVARRALLELEPSAVGSHLGVSAEDESAATHRFEATLGGYRGWQWAVVVAAPPGADYVTVSESALLPGPDALVAPEFVPWDQRVRPGDLAPGDLLAPPANDPRLVPGYVVTGDPVVDEVAYEVGLGRTQVLSLEGRAEAADRWYLEHGPDTDMAKAAPSTCGLCGFYLPLAGALRAAFGVCANAMGADGRVVHTEYGCGAHSDVEAPSGNGSPLYEAYDDAAYDVIPAESLRTPDAETSVTTATVATESGSAAAVKAETAADIAEAAPEVSADQEGTDPAGAQSSAVAAPATETAPASDGTVATGSAAAQRSTAEAAAPGTETAADIAESAPQVDASEGAAADGTAAASGNTSADEAVASVGQASGDAVAAVQPNTAEPGTESVASVTETAADIAESTPGGGAPAEQPSGADKVVAAAAETAADIAEAAPEVDAEAPSGQGTAAAESGVSGGGAEPHGAPEAAAQNGVGQAEASAAVSVRAKGEVAVRAEASGAETVDAHVVAEEASEAAEEPVTYVADSRGEVVAAEQVEMLGAAGLAESESGSSHR